MNVTRINLDGVERDIAFGARGIRAVESVLERPITELGKALGINEIVALVYGGLRQLDATVTVELVEDALDAHIASGGSVQDIAESITDALGASGWFGNPTRGEN